MSDYDKNFIETFNEYYPFERYIVKEPKRINYLFDDVVLTELFVPSTEIKPCVDEEGIFHGFTSINNEDIYVKLKCGDSEFRMAYYDFNDHIREEIRSMIIKDFIKWESLYVDYDDEDADKELKEALLIQKQLITNKYGKCNIKPDFIIEDTIKLLNKATNNEGNEVRTIRKFCSYCKDIHDVISRGFLPIQRVDNKITSEYECTNCGRKFRITEER